MVTENHPLAPPTMDRAMEFSPAGILRSFAGFLCFSVLSLAGAFPIEPVRGDVQNFTRGDANSDGSVDIADAITVLISLLQGGQDALSCADAGDANDDGALDIADAVSTLGFLFLRYLSPPPPSRECGADPTDDALGCESFETCPPPKGEVATENWVARFTTAEYSNDAAHALTVDAQGNVYVTGTATISHDGGDSYTDSAMLTVKYGVTGDQEWSARYEGYHDGNSGEAIAVDASGNVYVAGVSDGGPSAYQDIVVVKYDASGVPIWSSLYDSGGRDLVAAMVLDCEGCVYVTGESDAFADTEEDWVTIKYDAHGNEVWIDRYDGPAGRFDYPFALALGPDGNLYVAGSAYCGSYTSNDYTVVRYTPGGERTWVSHYDGDGHSADYATALAFDPHGNVCVTGRSHGIDSDFDYATVTFDANGDLLWAARYDGPSHGGDSAVALAVDARGNVYVAGHSERETDADHDFVVVSYDTYGRRRWSARYDGPDGGRDLVRGMALNDGDGIYVTGYVNGGLAGDASRMDFCTVAYDLAGRERWVAIYDGPASDRDEANAVCACPDGRVYVAGLSDWDYLTIGYGTAVSTEK